MDRNIPRARQRTIENLGLYGVVIALLAVVVIRAAAIDASAALVYAAFAMTFAGAVMVVTSIGLDIYLRARR